MTQVRPHLYTSALVTVAITTTAAYIITNTGPKWGNLMLTIVLAASIGAILAVLHQLRARQLDEQNQTLRSQLDEQGQTLNQQRDELHRLRLANLAELAERIDARMPSHPGDLTRR